MHTMRNSHMLYIPLFKTATGKRTFHFRTVKLWNTLDSTLKLKPTLQDFKRCLRRSLLSNFLIWSCDMKYWPASNKNNVDIQKLTSMISVLDSMYPVATKTYGESVLKDEETRAGLNRDRGESGWKYRPLASKLNRLFKKSGFVTPFPQELK
ncbi:hypothetical protein P5673_029927, partial [Acropora cervicornis]